MKHRKLALATALSAAAVMVTVSAAGGGVPGSFSYEENARATAMSSESLDVTQGTNFVIQTLILEPGWSSGWHYHPDDAWVLMKKGVLTQYSNCTERNDWTAGNAYYHHNGAHRGHHGEGPELARNEGKVPVEVTVLFFNVPREQPPSIIPRDVQPPPADCPTLD